MAMFFCVPLKSTSQVAAVKGAASNVYGGTSERATRRLKIPRLPAPTSFGVCLVGLVCLGSLPHSPCSALADSGSDQPQDRRQAEENNWVYNSLPKGFAEAKRTGKPLFVVIRCPP